MSGEDDLTARVQALQAMSEDMRAQIDHLRSSLAEARLTGLVAWCSLVGVVETVGGNEYFEYRIGQQLEHGFDALKLFDPTQEELDAYDLKAAVIRNAMAKGKRALTDGRSQARD